MSSRREYGLIDAIWIGGMVLLLLCAVGCWVAAIWVGHPPTAGKLSGTGGLVFAIDTMVWLAWGFGYRKWS